MSHPAQAALTLEVDNPAPTGGYFQLSWNQSLPEGILLQQSESVDFTKARQWNVNGVEAFSMSGLSNGKYFYRLLSNNNESSNTVEVNVTHHGLAKAWSFFTIGALLFVFLLGYIFLRPQIPSGAQS